MELESFSTIATFKGSNLTISEKIYVHFNTNGFRKRKKSNFKKN